MSDQTPAPLSPSSPSPEMTLDELFDRNPTELSPEEKEAIRRALIERKAIWAREEADAAKSGRRTKTASGMKKKSLADVDVAGILDGLVVPEKGDRK